MVELLEYKSRKTGQVVRVPADLPAPQRAMILERISRINQRGAESMREARIGSIETQAGAPLARTVPGETPFDVVQPQKGSIEELREGGLRFDAARSTTLEGAASKIRSKFPKAKVTIVDDPKGGQIITIQKYGDAKAVLLDSDEVFSLSDIIEVGGVALNTETLVSIAAAIATRGRSLTGRMAGQAAGGALGRSGDIAIEQARGHERLSLQQIAESVGLSAAIAGGAEGAFAPIRRMAQLARGGAVIKLTPEERLAAGEAKRSGTSLLLGQVGPIMRRQLTQARMTSKETEKRILDQMGKFADNLEEISRRTGDLTAFSDEAVDRIAETARQRLLNTVEASGRVRPNAGGNALIRTRKAYVKIEKPRIGRLYDEAIAASEGVTFGIDEAQGIARQIRRGVRGEAKEGAEGVRASAKPGPELQSIADRLLKLKSEVSAFDNNTSFEIMKALRSELFDLKNAAEFGRETVQNRMAGRLWSSLTDAMDNPIGGGDAFVKLYRRASVKNALKERTLEMADLRLIAGTVKADAGGLIRQIGRPHNGRALRVMARFAPDDFAAFQRAWKADLVTEPEKIASRLAAFRPDPNTLRLLVSSEEESMLRVIGADFVRFSKSPFIKAAEKTADRMVRAAETFGKSEADDLAKLIDLAGGKQSKLGRGLAAAAINDILDAGKRTIRGREVLDPKAAGKQIAALDKAGKLAAVMEPDLLAMVRRKRGMFSIAELPEDLGGGMQAAEIASNLASGAPPSIFINPLPFIKGITAKARNVLVGWILTNPTIRTLLLAGDRPLMDLTSFRALAVVTGEILADVGAKEEKQE